MHSTIFPIHSKYAFCCCLRELTIVPPLADFQSYRRALVGNWAEFTRLVRAKALPPIASAPSVFLIHHMLSIFSPQPLDTLETMLPFDPPLKRHESVVHTQPSPRAAPVRFHPHHRLIPALRCGAFNRRISEHEGDGWP